MMKASSPSYKPPFPSTRPVGPVVLQETGKSSPGHAASKRETTLPRSLGEVSIPTLRDLERGCGIVGWDSRRRRRVSSSNPGVLCTPALRAPRYLAEKHQKRDSHAGAGRTWRRVRRARGTLSAAASLGWAPHADFLVGAGSHGPGAGKGRVAQIPTRSFTVGALTCIKCGGPRLPLAAVGVWVSWHGVTHRPWSGLQDGVYLERFSCLAVSGLPRGRKGSFSESPQ